MKRYHFDDLTEINCPFGLLDDDTKARLEECGGPWEKLVDGNDYNNLKWITIQAPFFFVGYVYRQAKPEPTPDYVPWDQIAPKWKWYARDENGTACLFTKEPRQESRSYWAFGECSIRRIEDLLANFKIGTCDWRDSLQERPEDEMENNSQ